MHGNNRKDFTWIAVALYAALPARRLYFHNFCLFYNNRMLCFSFMVWRRLLLLLSPAFCLLFTAAVVVVSQLLLPIFYCYSLRRITPSTTTTTAAATCSSTAATALLLPKRCRGEAKAGTATAPPPLSPGKPSAYLCRRARPREE